MSKEPESYRENLERIIEKFPEKEMLSKTDVARLTGLDHRTVARLYPFKENYISIATLARRMSV